MNIKDYMWDIFSVAKEERTDGDAFEGDLSTALDLWLEAIHGNPSYQYECLEGQDLAGIAMDWDAMTDVEKRAAKAEYKEVLTDRYASLAKAFTEDDKAAFMGLLYE